MGLTKRGIDRLRYDATGPAQQIHLDDQPTGFGVRVFESGLKSFVLWYRSGGRRRLMTLGRFGDMTLQQARAKARSHLGDVADGVDPLEERQQERSRVAFAEFAKLYLERHAKPHKKTWKEDDRRLEKWLLPRWRTRRLDSISRADVAKLHATIGAKRRYEANRVLALVSIVFSKAIEWGYLAEGAANPAARVEQFKERSRERWLREEEVARLLEAVEAEQSPFYRAAFKLYLLTGFRRSELLSLRWDDVDLERRTAYLRETKANRPHLQPLSAPAAVILAELPHQRGNPFIFPSPTVVGGHLSDLKTPWRRVRERAQLEDVRLHDLRRTVGTMLARDGESLQLIGKVLNHSETRTTEVYARLTEDVTREALERHGEKIVSLSEWKARRTA